MIYVGVETEWLNCAGASKISKIFFECNDYHEAAKEVYKCGKSNGFTCTTVKNAEFHDTETGRTWSVNSCGHSKGNYHREESCKFKSRWLK